MGTYVLDEILKSTNLATVSVFMWYLATANKFYEVIVNIYL